MRIVKAWITVMVGTVLFGTLSWSCFIVPECLHCADGSTGGSGAGGGNTGSTDEDCTDGIDNDGNGDVDCADSRCTPDFECFPVPPGAWVEVYAISVMDFSGKLPVCENGQDPAVFFASPADSAECAACSCGPLDVMSAACSPPQISCYVGSTDCSSAASDWTDLLAEGACDKPQNLGGVESLSCKITAISVPLGGDLCAPSGGEIQKNKPWKERVGVCVVPNGGGCDAGQVCAATQRVQDAACVRRDGDFDCPTDEFTVKKLVYEIEEGHRSCGACTCTPKCTGGSYTVHDLDECGDDADPVIIDSDDCKDVSGLLDASTWSMNATLSQIESSCTPGGGAPQVDLSKAGPVTFCCRH